jgi:hypothetical protein
MDRRAEAYRVDEVRAADVAAPPPAERRPAGGWILVSSGVMLLLASVWWVSMPPMPVEDDFVCGDEAALTVVLRPATDTSAACRDQAVADTVLGGVTAALGIATLVGWGLRRRSFEEELAGDEPEDEPEVPSPRQQLPIPDLVETGLRPDRLAVHVYTNTGLLLGTAAVAPFVFLQLARTLPAPDAELEGVRWLLGEAWFIGYLALVFGAAWLLWWEAASQLMRHPWLVLDRHGLTAEDQPYVAWAEVADLTFGLGSTEDDDEVAVLELRLRPADERPEGETVRYDLEGLSVEAEEIAALAQSLHQRSSGSAPTEPSADHPGDVRPVWRIAAVLTAAAGLLLASTWFGLLVAGGWPGELRL